MSRPWMPLYVADYRRDTPHLSAAEHGAYLLLIMHYWANGGLPDDDRQLARIASMTPAQWKKARPVVQAFFQDGWKHKRIEFEMTEAARISNAGRIGGRASAEARRQRKTNDPATTVERPLNDRTNDPATKGQALQPPSLAKAKGADAPSDPKADLFRRGREVLGKEAGALIAKLLRSIGQEDDPKVIAKARARIEEASTKAEPIPWLTKTMGPKQGEFRTLSGMEGII